MRNVIRFEVPQKTVVLFEAPDRIKDTLTALAAIEQDGATKICIARELTKIHEEAFRGSLSGACEWVTNGTHRERGEFCLLLHRPSTLSSASPLISTSVDVVGNVEGINNVAPDAGAAARISSTLVKNLLERDVPLSSAVAAVAKSLQMKKSDLYKRALEIQQDLLLDEHSAQDTGARKSKRGRLKPKRT